MIQPKVSVIIPVYKAEPYIEKCVRSLFGQTLDDIEYVFVDDCSPDNSIGVMQKVLEEYPNRCQQVKVIRHDNNKGVSQTRQDGLDAAIGEYIIHCDPDDWVELDMYESLYNTAKATDADLVICDFYEEIDKKKEIYQSQNIPIEKNNILKEIIEGSLHSSLCNKLICRKYIEKVGVRFNPEISLWEDMAYMTPILMTECKISKIDKALYHYRCVLSSISRSLSLSSVMSQIKAVETIEEFIMYDNPTASITKTLDILKLRSKDYFLISGESFSPEMWRKTFPKSHKRIFCKSIPIKKKVLYFLCDQHYDSFVGWLANLRKKCIKMHL